MQLFFFFLNQPAVAWMSICMDQVVVWLNMDGYPDSMAVADLGKDPSLVVDVEVVS